MYRGKAKFRRYPWMDAFFRSFHFFCCCCFAKFISKRTVKIVKIPFAIGYTIKWNSLIIDAV